MDTVASVNVSVEIREVEREEFVKQSQINLHFDTSARQHGNIERGSRGIWTGMYWCAEMGSRPDTTHDTPHDTADGHTPMDTVPVRTAHTHIA